MGTIQKMEADVAICGGGASGLTAALTAGSGNANVVLFEKRKVLGGTSVFAEGLFAVESPMQERQKIRISKEEIFRKHMEYSHWRANSRLVKAFIDKSGNTVDWLKRHGVEFDGPTAYFPGGPEVFHWIKGGGTELVKAMHGKALEKDIRIFKKTSSKRLLADSTGRITGLIAEDGDGNDIHVNAGAVIIASGDFADNKKMLLEYTEFGHNAINRINNMNRTGDGILMAWEAGAAPEGTNVLLASPWVPGEKRESYLKSLAFKPHLWVNLEGRRFCAEDLHFPFSGNALASQPDGIMWIIFDTTTMRMMIEAGTQFRLGNFVPVDKDLLNADIERGTKQGKAAVADSLKDLADKIEIDSMALENTVMEYNRGCEQHYDTLFAKNPDHMRPVIKAPFYAIKSCFHLTSTLGGIKINEKTEVLKKDGKIIPGLYAVGTCAGGLYGESYDVTNTTGGALGFAVNSGCIAGEAVLKYLGIQ